nr:hypothetical protein [Tanacetum cinerariifolium]
MNGARPNRTSFNKHAHSYPNRPFQRTSAVRSQFRAPWVPTANRNFPPVSRKFSTVSRNFLTVNRKFFTPNRKFSTNGTKFSTADMGKKGKAVKPSACNISYLSDYEPFDGGYVFFGQGGCKITGKGTIKTGKLEFENVYFVKDLKYNLFSVSQMCDNKNSVLFTDSECIVLGRDFKLLNDVNILLRTPRRLGHLNFKTMNKLVRHNLVRGLPTKCFENDHTCTACLKGKQHKASSSADECIVWHRRLGHLNVKTMNKLKRIKREFSNAMTPQQNGVAKRRNRTLIEAARTMLADAKLLVTFWAKAVNTACYVQNRVLVNKQLRKFEEKKDEGCFIGYSMSSKAFNVFNKRTKRVEENLHVDFLENKAIEKGTKDATSQEAKKDVSCLRYIALPNWAHDALLEYSSSKPQDHCSTEVAKGSGNPNPIASTSNPTADQMETLTVETPIPTFSSPVPTSYSTNSQEPSKESNRVEADISNMETAFIASPTPTLRIHKDHPKSQIIVYQMDVKSAFLYGTIDEEVYVM